ncbi:MAG: hypothetical protein WCI41_00350 [bacterium]
MNYDDDELAEEVSFKTGGSDEEDEFIDDIDDPLDPILDDDIGGFIKEEEPEEKFSDSY